MQMNPRWSGPPVREVVWEAVQRFTGGDVDVEFAIRDIKAIILKKYPDFNVNTIGSQIIAQCANSASRRHHGPDIDRYWRVKYGVYRLYEPEQPVDLDEVLEKIKKIAKASATGDYIYRGEPECYDKVSSSLYREYLDIEAEHFDVKVVQADILRAAHEYTLHKMEDFELLATLQHFGDKTNLIDFTTDYLVALFFACDGETKELGRVILLRRQSESDPKAYEVKKSPRTIRRAEAQKSIFVQAPKGFIEPDRIVTIPAHLKAALLDYLRNHHDISTKTIYNDLQGFIENRGLHKNAYTEFYKGVTSQGGLDSAKTEAERQKLYDDAITRYTEAIALNPELTEAYSNRGVAYRNTGDFAAAIADYSKAIDLDPEDARFYHGRGFAYFTTGDFAAAIADYSKAIDLNPELAAAITIVAMLTLGKRILLLLLQTIAKQ